MYLVSRSFDLVGNWSWWIFLPSEKAWFTDRILDLEHNGLLSSITCAGSGRGMYTNDRWGHVCASEVTTAFGHLLDGQIPKKGKGSCDRLIKAVMDAMTQLYVYSLWTSLYGRFSRPKSQVEVAIQFNPSSVRLVKV